VIFGRGCGVLFLLLLVVKILKFVFASRRVTTEVIHAAIVCYLLLGLCWAFIYVLIENLHPGSFSVSSVNAANASTAYTYFSFVTLTTLGYGDISPVAEVARSFAILEAITGQMYLAVLVARLVGMQIAHDMAAEK
jgi:voltage-gated potassium channel Kch